MELSTDNPITSGLSFEDAVRHELLMSFIEGLKSSAIAEPP